METNKRTTKHVRISKEKEEKEKKKEKRKKVIENNKEKRIVGVSFFHGQS